MKRSDLTALVIVTVMGMAIASTEANAGNGNAVGAGLLGLGVGAIVGSALTPREVYVVPSPPPPPAYYGPAAYYGPEPWSPGWYRYCRRMYGPSFNPNTGYFLAPDGGGISANKGIATAKPPTPQKKKPRQGQRG